METLIWQQGLLTLAGIDFCMCKKLSLYFYFSGTINHSPSMHLPRYNYKTNNSFLDYEFTSEGPGGSIKKVVRVSQRTRLYRMGITNNWQEISNEFEVWPCK